MRNKLAKAGSIVGSGKPYLTFHPTFIIGNDVLYVLVKKLEKETGWYPWPSVCSVCKHGCVNQICTPCKDSYVRGLTCKVNKPTFIKDDKLNIHEIRYRQRFHPHKKTLIIHASAYQHILNKHGEVNIRLDIRIRNDSQTCTYGYYFE